MQARPLPAVDPRTEECEGRMPESGVSIVPQQLLVHLGIEFGTVDNFHRSLSLAEEEEGLPTTARKPVLQSILMTFHFQSHYTHSASASNSCHSFCIFCHYSNPQVPLFTSKLPSFTTASQVRLVSRVIIFLSVGRQVWEVSLQVDGRQHECIAVKESRDIIPIYWRS